MTFLTLLAVLLLEQARPLRQGNLVHRWFDGYAAGLASHFNGGQYRQGVIAWTLAVAPVLAVTVAAYLVFYELTPIAGWLWSIVVLYLTMGFRQFSRYFTEIRLSLHAGDLVAARARLGEWRGESAAELNAGEIARVAIEQGLLDSHRHVFGVIAWFVALGPAGAVLYRASAVLADRWSAGNDAEIAEFGRFAGRAFIWIDWLPARLTAATFAMTGNFEDAIYCWRTQADAWAARVNGIILASAGGALGMRLGNPLPRNGSLQFRPELGMGDEVDPDHMQSAEGLVWRSLVLWMFLIFLVSLAHALG